MDKPRNKKIKILRARQGAPINRLKSKLPSMSLKFPIENVKRLSM